MNAGALTGACGIVEDDSRRVVRTVAQRGAVPSRVTEYCGKHCPTIAGQGIAAEKKV